MKRMIKILISALVLVGHGALASGSEPFVKVNDKGTKEFFLFMKLDDLDHEKSTISLIGKSGEVIYQEQLKGGTEYRKLFDVRALPEGDYTLEIEDGNRIKSWSLSILNGQLKLDENEQDRFKPTVVRLNENKLGLSLLNKIMANAKVSIYDHQSGETLLSESLGNELIIQRIYDMSLLEKGSYTVSVRWDDRIYEETIDL